MLFIIFSIAVILVFGFLIFQLVTGEDDFGIFIVKTILLGVGALLGTGIFAGIANVLPVTSTSSETQNLKALGLSSEVGGRLFLGSGTIDQKPTYTYYIDHGTYSILTTTEAEKALIFEDGGATVVYNYDHRDHGWWGGNNRTPGIVEFHIPENSIVETTTLDLSK